MKRHRARCDDLEAILKAKPNSVSLEIRMDVEKHRKKIELEKAVRRKFKEDAAAAGGENTGTKRMKIADVQQKLSDIPDEIAYYPCKWFVCNTINAYLYF